MKDRTVTLLGAIASLALVVALLLPDGSPPKAVSKPTSEDRGPVGLRGLEKWLTANGVPTLSLRRRYGDLALMAELAPSGNLLVTSLPQTYPTVFDELQALETWLAEGNHLLVLTAEYDAPDWALADPWGNDDALLWYLGFEFAVVDDEADGTENEDETDFQKVLLAGIDAAREQVEGLRRKPVALRPAAADPLLAGVTEVSSRVTPLMAEVESRLEGNSERRLALPLLLSSETDRGALWEVRTTGGRAWVSSYPDLFGNRTLGEADNARLLLNILRAALTPDGVVIFDDLHQGLSNLYDPEAFFGDSRLHNTLWFIFAFWLLYVVGHSNRLAPPVPQEWRVHAAALVEAMASLFARRLPPASVASGLLHHFFNEVRARYKLPQTGRPCWDVLAAAPSVQAEELEALKRIAGHIEAGRKPNLRDLGLRLNRIRQDLA